MCVVSGDVPDVYRNLRDRDLKSDGVFIGEGVRNAFDPRRYAKLE